MPLSEHTVRVRHLPTVHAGRSTAGGAADVILSDLSRARMSTTPLPLLRTLQAYVDHADERVPLALLSSVGHEATVLSASLAWSVYERALQDALTAGEGWTPLLDAAAYAIERLPACYTPPNAIPAPATVADRLEGWVALSATDADLQACARAFRSAVFHEVALRSLTRFTPGVLSGFQRGIHGWQRGLATNPNYARGADVTALVDWAMAEMGEDDDGNGGDASYASGVLCQLLQQGWVPSRHVVRQLLALAGLEVLDDPDAGWFPGNIVAPVAEVLLHERCPLTADELQRVVRDAPIHIDCVLAQAVTHPAATPLTWAKTLEAAARLEPKSVLQEVAIRIAEKSNGVAPPEVARVAARLEAGLPRDDARLAALEPPDLFWTTVQTLANHDPGATRNRLEHCTAYQRVRVTLEAIEMLAASPEASLREWAVKLSAEASA